MNHWSFAASPGVVVVGVALWLLSGWISWTNWQRSGKAKAQGRLESLRFMLVTLLALTLFRPEWIQIIKRTEKPEVAILMDGSKSMETRDVLLPEGVTSRGEWVQQQIARKFWQPLEKTARVETSEFPGDSNPTNKTAAKPPEGTDLNAALESTLQSHRNLKAALVLSDGDWNTGKSPVGAAARFREQGVPIYSVSIGRETPVPDLILENVTPPSYGLFGEQVSIPFRITSHLPKEVKTTILLMDGNREETRKDITIPAQGDLQEAVLWTPRNVGESALNLKLPVQPEESIRENNEQSFRINVRVDKLRVLVVDSFPRWEYRYLRNALARDPGVDMNCILFHPGLRAGGGEHYLPAFPGTKEQLSRYDVIFLGDVGVGQGELTENDAQLIKGLIEQQSSGLVFLPGRRGRQFTFLNSALKDLLPVVLDQSKPEGIALQNESVLTLSTQGRRHLLTRFDSDETRNNEIWKQLPGFYWSAAVEKSRPGSEVIAVHSSMRNASGRMPLLVTRPAGSGKVLFMGTDSAWRWRRGVEDKFHYRFWSQVVRWMAHQRHLSEKQGIRLAYSPESPQVGDTVYLQATVLNQAGFPIEEGPVFGSITTPSKRTEHLEFTTLEGGWGVFKSTFIAQEGGKYSIVVSSDKDDRKLDTQLAVTKPVIEKVGVPMNRGILREIASITGGTNANVDGLDQIIEALSVLPEPKPIERRIRLWSSPYWGGAILTLLGVYWVGRKIAGMI